MMNTTSENISLLINIHHTPFSTQKSQQTDFIYSNTSFHPSSISCKSNEKFHNN